MVRDFNLMRRTLIQHGQSVELLGIQKSNPVIARQFLAGLAAVDRDSELQQLLAEFSDLFQEPMGLHHVIMTIGLLWNMVIHLCL